MLIKRLIDVEKRKQKLENLDPNQINIFTSKTVEEKYWIH